MLLKKQLVYRLKFVIKFSRCRRINFVCRDCIYDYYNPTERSNGKCILSTKYSINHRKLLCAVDIYNKYNIKDKERTYKYVAKENTRV